MHRSQPVVAIDGPAGSGKTTVARRVAEALGFTLVDTGALYRSLAFLAQRRGVAWEDGPALGRLAGELSVRFEDDGLGRRLWLGAEEITEAIRTPEMSAGASRVSVHAGVRQALLGVQRNLGQKGGVVMEGRDIGTVVFPDAEIKVFLDASPEVRALRRHKELEARRPSETQAETLAETLNGVRDRDARDSSRELAPLRPAQNAVILDTGPLTLDEVVAEVLALVKRWQPRVHKG